MDNTTEFTFVCPHCGQHLAAELNMVGMELECPSCGKTLQVPSPSSTPQGEPPKLRNVSPEDEAKSKLTNGVWQTKAVFGKASSSTYNAVAPVLHQLVDKWNGLELRQKKRAGIAVASLIAVFVVLSCIMRVACSASHARRSAKVAIRASNESLSQLASDMKDNADHIKAEQDDGRRRIQEQQERDAFKREKEALRQKEEEASRAKLAKDEAEARKNRDEERATEEKRQQKDEQRKISVDSISSYRYDPTEIATIFDSNLTSAKRLDIWKRIFKRGLPQDKVPYRQLYTEIPDGIVFTVKKVAPANERNDLMTVALAIPGSDESKGGKTSYWEYRHSIKGMQKEGFRNYSDTYWKDAPWKKQTGKWGKEFIAMFPGIDRNGYFMMLISTKMIGWERMLEALHEGSFIVSKDWIASITVSDENDNPTERLGQYWLYPSEETALVVAGIESRSPLAGEFIVIPPRDKRDVILKRLVNNHGKLPWLNEIFHDLKRILPDVTLGDEFKHIIEEATPSRKEFELLRKYAGGDDKATFSKELDRVTAILDDIQNRPASAVNDGFFQKHKLKDEKRAFELDIDADKDKQLWATYHTQFLEIWDSGFSDTDFAEYCKGILQAFPDDVSFVVEDVHEGKYGYSVDLRKLEYGERPMGFHDRDIRIMACDKDGKWLGDKRQNSLFWNYVEERFGGGNGGEYSRGFKLRASKPNKFIENLTPGQIIKSKGWVREVILENSIAQKQQYGRSWVDRTRKIHFKADAYFHLSAKDLFDVIEKSKRR